METKLKPTFKLSLNLMRAFLFMTPFSLILILVSLGNTTQNTMTLAALWLFIYLGIVYFIRGSLKNTTYLIEDNKIMQQTHFLGRRYKEVLLHNVKEVELRVGILQNLFGLGKVVIHTQVILSGNQSSGISLLDIEEPDLFYKTLKKAVSKQQKH